MLKKILLSALVLASGNLWADSLWEHNGSLMRLVTSDNGRAFYYEVPSQKMRAAGVTRGTLLFDGYRQGDAYYGTSRVFSKYCGSAPLEYAVNGFIADAQTTVVLTGTRDIYQAGCIPTGKTTQDRLVFKYVRNVN